MNKGTLVVVSGFSGAGKGTLMRRLTEKYDSYQLSVSATTRKPRTGEQDGREYFFKTTDEFRKMIDEDELIEYAVYNGNYYGTPRAFVEEQMSRGRHILLEIEVQGARKIREKFPGALLIFVTSPTAEDLRRRLEGRGTDSQENIRSRLRLAVEESRSMDVYDYVLVNDEVERCVDALNSIVEKRYDRPPRDEEFIARIQKELELMMKGEAI